MKVHLTLSGPNASEMRAVFANDVEIGTVRKSLVTGSWYALGLHGEQHGIYTTDWNAAKQLALALGMDAE